MLTQLNDCCMTSDLNHNNSIFFFYFPESKISESNILSFGYVKTKIILISLNDANFATNLFKG